MGSENSKIISERDPNVQIEEDDFSPQVGPTVLNHEKTRGSQLEGIFPKKSSKNFGEINEHNYDLIESRKT